MKNPPKGWPRLSAMVVYQDAVAAIDWLGRAFGFEVRLKVEGDDGKIVHAELVYGEALVMPAQEGTGDKGYAPGTRSPKSLDGKFTQALLIHVEDVEAHCARARAAGAKIFFEPKVSDYGEDYWADKNYGAIDLEGHHWWFSERVRDPKK
jgi:uncharacterized glyoxalase superfamily protein PhnB